MKCSGKENKCNIYFLELQKNESSSVDYRK